MVWPAAWSWLHLIWRLKIKEAVRQGYCRRFQVLLLHMLHMEVSELGFQLQHLVDCLICGEKLAMSSGQVFQMQEYGMLELTAKDLALS